MWCSVTVSLGHILQHFPSGYHSGFVNFFLVPKQFVVDPLGGTLSIELEEMQL